MKNVYSPSLNTNGKIILEPNASGIRALKAGTLQLRGFVAVMVSLLLISGSFTLNAQNCPTTGTHTFGTSENTFYTGQGSAPAGATSISLGPIGSGLNFGNTPIAIGDIVLIIQMQGAQIFLPASSQATTYGGNVSGIGSGFIATSLSAGNMEFAVATNAVPVGGGTLNIAAALVNSYSNTGYVPAGAGQTGQYTYQVIRVPQYFNVQLGAGIKTPRWNGSTGGVTVISAVSQLDMNGKTVDAVGSGFRGGSTKAYSGASGLSYKDFYTLSTTNANGGKGEGIAGTPRYVYFFNAQVNTGIEGYPGGSNARGGPANAGGGATDSNPGSNDQNAGGGGGGNGGTGGLGGNGWQSFGFTGGHGGTSFSIGATNYYSPSRLILGGGGGSGSTNNASGSPSGGVATSGSAGGGLVIINSSTIINAGTINASGDTANNSVTVDGSGGGGAGGSILIYANSGHSGITAIANGGNGADNRPAGLNATQHGPGGGGGGGVVFSNGALNAGSSVAGGVAGVSYGTSVTDNYGAFPGLVGVLTQTFPFSQLPPKMQTCQAIVLPVTLLNFSASYESSNNVKVSWTTTDEVNAAYFVVERSTDASGFAGIAQVSASESLNPVNNYTVNDQLTNVNSNIVYYRLRIVDMNGKYTYSKVVPVKLDQPKNAFSIYPNPVDNYAVMNIYSERPGTGMMRLVDNAGKQISTKSFPVNNGNNSVLIDQLGFLPKGIYIVQVMVNNNLYNQKIVKK